jgi:hypothetical protein
METILNGLNSLLPCFENRLSRACQLSDPFTTAPPLLEFCFMPGEHFAPTFRPCFSTDFGPLTAFRSFE